MGTERHLPGSELLVIGEGPKDRARGVEGDLDIAQRPHVADVLKQRLAFFWAWRRPGIRHARDRTRGETTRIERGCPARYGNGDPGPVCAGKAVTRATPVDTAIALIVSCGRSRSLG